MVIVALGAAQAASAELSVAVPRSLARPFACLGLVVGAIAAAAPDGWVAAEPAPLVVGSVMVFLSLRRRTFVYMAGGLAALFMGLAARRPPRQRPHLGRYHDDRHRAVCCSARW